MRPARYITRWRVECTVCTPDALTFYVRWVAPNGRGYRLHPAELRWIAESLALPLPPFLSAFQARVGIMEALTPPEYPSQRRNGKPR